MSDGPELGLIGDARDAAAFIGHHWRAFALRRRLRWFSRALAYARRMRQTSPVYAHGLAFVNRPGTPRFIRCEYKRRMRAVWREFLEEEMR